MKSTTRAQSSSINQQFISTYKVENDQKSIILEKLRQEADQLRKNQSQFNMLKQQYSNLDRKYRAQQEQKVLQDLDFKNRHDCALRHIGQLKNQIDAIKAQLRDKKIQIQDLAADEQTLKNAVQQRNIELEKLRVDINALLLDSEQLQNQRLSFCHQVESLRKNNSKLSQDLFNFQKQNQNCENRLADLQKYLDQLEAESKILRQKIVTYEDTNNDLDNQIQQTNNELSELSNMLYQSQQTVSDYQIANANIGSNADQFKSEAVHSQKASQAEVMKNNDLIKKLKQAEHTLGIRVAQAQQGYNQINSLKAQNQKLDESNSNLGDSLEACRKHLQNLGLLNHQLVSLLQNFSQEDSKVMEIVNREHRVKHLSDRVQQTSSIQFYNGKDTARTDVSFSTSRRIRF